MKPLLTETSAHGLTMSAFNNRYHVTARNVHLTGSLDWKNKYAMEPCVGQLVLTLVFFPKTKVRADHSAN